MRDARKLIETAEEIRGELHPDVPASLLDEILMIEIDAGLEREEKRDRVTAAISTAAKKGGTSAAS